MNWNSPETIKDSPKASFDNSTKLWWHPFVLVKVSNKYGDLILVARLDAEMWLAPDMDRIYYEIPPDRITGWAEIPE